MTTPELWLWQDGLGSTNTNSSQIPPIDEAIALCKSEFVEPAKMSNRVESAVLILPISASAKIESQQPFKSYQSGCAKGSSIR